jgi:glucose/arabinose dehydrogenase
MVKKFFIFFAALIFLSALIYGVYFYQKNLRGVRPAIVMPSKDISNLINTGEAPLRLPPNFSISIFAKNLKGPRVMQFDSLGNLLVSIPSQGQVVALLPDKDGDGLTDEVKIVAEGLNRPHGLAFKCNLSLSISNERCYLYIAETDGVAIYDYDLKNLKAINKRKIIDLPSDGGHFTRTIMFMAQPNNDRLLISVGSSCNVCEESDWRRAKILIANADGSGLKEFASGLRNAVFMAIHPVTGAIWATEMGRDFLGDDEPPDEINIIREGKNYGWPYCYGANIRDVDFNSKKLLDKVDRNKKQLCENKYEPSYIDIPAHSAPLGLSFFPEEGWPEEYWYNLLVAYHGSWNRSVPTGYKIVRYKLDVNGKYLGEEDFISGWLQNKNALGRPVDILIQPGGVIYISDDHAGVIYKVNYNENKPKTSLLKINPQTKIGAGIYRLLKELIVFYNT